MTEGRRKLALTALLVIGIAPFEFNGWYNQKLSIHGFWIAEMLAWIVLPTMIVLIALKSLLITRDELGFNTRVGRRPAPAVLVLLLIVFPILDYHVDRWAVARGPEYFPANYLALEKNYRDVLPPPDPKTGWLRLVATCYFALSAGFVEEVYYRAMMSSLFRRGWVRDCLYVVISVVVFASVHWEAGVREMFEAAVFGVIAAVFFRATGNIWPLIVSHVIVDFLWLT